MWLAGGGHQLFFEFAPETFTKSLGTQKIKIRRIWASAIHFRPRYTVFCSEKWGFRIQTYTLAPQLYIFLHESRGNLNISATTWIYATLLHRSHLGDVNELPYQWYDHNCLTDGSVGCAVNIAWKPLVAFLAIFCTKRVFFFVISGSFICISTSYLVVRPQMMSSYVN